MANVPLGQLQCCQDVIWGLNSFTDSVVQAFLLCLCFAYHQGCRKLMVEIHVYVYYMLNVPVDNYLDGEKISNISIIPFNGMAHRKYLLFLIRS